MNKILRVNLALLLILGQIFLPANDLLASNPTDDSPETADQQASPPQQNTEYPFIAGDAVEISTYPDTTSFLNGIFAITDEGFIEFPIGDVINVTTMTKDQLSQHIRSNYQNYMRSPNLIIKPLMRIAIIGGFTTPGFYYATYDMSLWQLIQTAGGLNNEDAITEINWERNGERVIDDVIPYLENGVSLKNMGFKSGDMVWAPSPTAEDSWQYVATRILPFAAFATSLYLMWVSYQTMVLLANGR